MKDWTSTRRLAGRRAFFGLVLDDLFGRAAGHTAMRLPQAVIERGDALRIALLHGEDDIFARPVDEVVGLLAVWIVADRAHGELVAAGIDAAEQGGQAGHGCMLDGDAEQLADGVERSVVAPVISVPVTIS